MFGPAADLDPLEPLINKGGLHPPPSARGLLPSRLTGIPGCPAAGPPSRPRAGLTRTACQRAASESKRPRRHQPPPRPCRAQTPSESASWLRDEGDSEERRSRGSGARGRGPPWPCSCRQPVARLLQDSAATRDKEQAEQETEA